MQTIGLKKLIDFLRGEELQIEEAPTDLPLAALHDWGQSPMTQHVSLAWDQTEKIVRDVVGDGSHSML